MINPRIENEEPITKYDLYYESRISSLETIAKHLIGDMREIKSDLRRLLTLLVGFGSVILGLMAHGFHWY